MPKFGDVKALTHTVHVLGTECKVTTIQTSKTVFQADGDYEGKSFTGKGGTRNGALAQWIHFAEKSQD